MSTANVDPIIKQLAQRRRELKLSASQVGLRMALSDTIVAQFERGIREPNPRVLRRWANELGMEVTLKPIQGGVCDA